VCASHPTDVGEGVRVDIKKSTSRHASTLAKRAGRSTESRFAATVTMLPFRSPMTSSSALEEEGVASHGLTVQGDSGGGGGGVGRRWKRVGGGATTEASGDLVFFCWGGGSETESTTKRLIRKG
jgi:hypothetical protein